MSSRKRRRVRRRVRRASVATLTIAALALTLFVIPAGAASVHYDADASTSIDDIQSFWSSALPATYKQRYEAIPDSRVFPYSKADPPPGCGTRGRTPYEEVAGNAFYCDEGNFIAYDEEQLIPAMRKAYGDFAVGLVLAHEIGHAVQGQVGFPSNTSVYVELQADCFAGAWAGHVQEGSAGALRLSTDDLDRALAGFLQLRDPSGVDGSQDGAHGNAFDRVSAFQDGLEGGAATCRDYRRTPPAVTESGFVSYEDQAVNGDPPLDEALPMLTQSLDDYWSQMAKQYRKAPELEVTKGAPSCAKTSDGGVVSEQVVYCADTNTVEASNATLTKAARDIGDMGAGVYVAAAWSSAVQHAIGVRIGNESARTMAECLTGAWAGSVEEGNAASSRQFAFSPGDLDEVVATFVATTRETGTDHRGSVFDRIQRFRAGFDGGPSACLPQ